ncbi:uncharacterized protein LOC115218491 [Argonauta hians]
MGRLVVVGLFLVLCWCCVESWNGYTKISFENELLGNWTSSEGMVLSCERTNNSLTATLMIPCDYHYKLQGFVSQNDSFFFYGTEYFVSIGVAGQLFRTNQTNVMKISLMVYEYPNCTENGPTKLSTHELRQTDDATEYMGKPDTHNWHDSSIHMYETNEPPQEATNCNIEGSWYNELGSKIVVRQNKDRELYGNYYTAVERYNGTSGEGHSIIHGHISHGSVFSFGVIWNYGTSVAIFVGQCIHVPNNGTYLKAQWVLVVSQESILSSWRAFYSGMNTFYRESERGFSSSWLSKEGLEIYFNGSQHSLAADIVLPCGRHFTLHGSLTGSNTVYLYGGRNVTTIGITGLLFKTSGSQVLKVTLMRYEYINCTQHTPIKYSSHELNPTQGTYADNHPESFIFDRYDYLTSFWDTPLNNKALNCSLEGTWYNDLGSSMEVRQKEDGILEGTYHSAVEYGHNSSEGASGQLSGFITRVSVFTFGVVWNNGTSITVFSGQCIPQERNGTILRSHWSLVSATRNIEDSWKAFHIGENTFFRE